MKKKELIGYVQTFIMLAMFVIMLVLCGLYIRFAESFGDGALPTFPESEIILLSKDAELTLGSEKYLVSPYFVAVCTESFMEAQPYGEEHSDEIWQSFVRVLESYSGEYEKIVFEDSAEKEKYLGSLYEAKGEYFYAKMRSETEFSVLLASLSDTFLPSFETVQFKVSDMFLLEDEVGGAYICAVSGSGDILKIFPDEKTGFNKDDYISYNNKETENFEFIKIENNVAYGKNGYFPVFRHSLTFPGILKAEFSEVFEISESSKDAYDFISIFSMNSDNTKNYKTADGDMVYVEDSVRLSISENGKIEYIPGESGSDISKFTPDTYSGGDGFFEIFAAAKSIANKVNDKLSGFAGMLALERVTYSDGVCRFYFNYTVQSVPVKSENYALYIEFSGSSLTYASLDVELYLLSEEHKTDMPQKTSYILMKDDIEGAVDYFGAEYSFDENSESGKGVVRWTVRTRGEDGK